MPTAVTAPIVLDERGVAYIEGTSMKVVELVSAWLAGGETPEQLQQAFPHLTLEHVYAALSYYHGHREDLDAEMEARHRVADGLRQELGQHPAADKLRAALDKRR